MSIIPLESWVDENDLEANGHVRPGAEIGVFLDSKNAMNVREVALVKYPDRSIQEHVMVSNRGSAPKLRISCAVDRKLIRVYGFQTISDLARWNSRRAKSGTPPGKPPVKTRGMPPVIVPE